MFPLQKLHSDLGMWACTRQSQEADRDLPSAESAANLAGLPVLCSAPTHSINSQHPFKHILTLKEPNVETKWQRYRVLLSALPLLPILLCPNLRLLHLEANHKPGQSHWHLIVGKTSSCSGCTAPT